MRNIAVLHVGQVPFMAALFFPPLPSKDVSFASFISLLALHFTQYASIEKRLIFKHNSILSHLQPKSKQIPKGVKGKQSTVNGRQTKAEGNGIAVN
jgi:hypothetical protein